MQILILGAGYAGLRTAVTLDELLHGRDLPIEVTLVDQNPYHQIIQLLHLTATAAMAPEDTIVPLQRIFAQRNVRLHQGRVARIEPLQRRVVLADGTVMPYDRLAITLGATTNFAGIPGAAEHSLTLHSYDDALRLRDHIAGSFARASKTSDPIERRILLTTAIVGGGYTGVQVAGELAMWSNDLAREHGVERSDVRIAVVERSPLLVKQFGNWASRAAVDVLDRRGVSVYLNTSVDRVEAQALYIAENRVLRAGTVVWAAGIRGPAVLADSGLAADERSGRLLVDRYLRVQDQALIFAAGDCAHIPGPGDEKVPATASYALRQGDHLAEVLLADSQGYAPHAYLPVKLGEVVSLGPNEAVGNPLGVPVFGTPAALLKKGIEAWYRSTLEAAS